MKKLVYIFAVLAIALTSCKKDPIGMTSAEPLAGEWRIVYDIIDGEDVYEDGYGMGYCQLLTYNTADNKNEMFVDDCGSFWEYKIIVNFDCESQTFSSADFVDNYAYESGVKIYGGKVTYGGTESPSGAVADAIEFYVEFDDDDYEFVYHAHGYRYTGLASDE